MEDLNIYGVLIIVAFFAYIKKDLLIAKFKEFTEKK